MISVDKYYGKISNFYLSADPISLEVFP
jgi:hypothetical protein